MRKFGLISKEFADTVPADHVYDLKVTIKKMFKHSESETFGPDLISLFQQLDSGLSVNINKLSDDYLKGKMLKVFGLLRLQHGKASQGKALKFIKRKSALHEFDLAKLMSHLFTQIKKEQDEQGDDRSEDEDFESDSNELEITEEIPGQAVEIKQPPMAVKPKYKVRNDQSSDSEQDTKHDFLSSTLSLIQGSKRDIWGSS